MKAWFQDTTTGQVTLEHMCGGTLVAPDAVVTGEGVQALRAAQS